MQRDLYLEEIQPEDETRHAWAKTEGLLKKHKPVSRVERLMA